MTVGASVLATGCGLAMAAAAGSTASGPAAVASAGAVVAVGAGLWWRPAATAAVLAAVTAIALAGPPPALAALSGLFAVGYLVLRHTGEVAGVTAPTAAAAAGFTVVGLVATIFPLRVPWLPVLAPVAAIGCYLLVIRPFVADRG